MFEWLWNRQFNHILNQRNKLASEFFENVSLLRNSSHEIHPNIVEYSNAMKDLMLVQNEYLDKKMDIMDSLKQSPENLVVFYQLMNDYNVFVKDFGSVMEELEVLELPFMNLESNKLAKENITRINSLIDYNHVLIKKVIAKCQAIDINQSEPLGNDHIVEYPKNHVFPK